MRKIFHLEEEEEEKEDGEKKKAIKKRVVPCAQVDFSFARWLDADRFYARVSVCVCKTKIGAREI